MHLVGFIIKIYHDAQSSECEIHTVVFCAPKKVTIIFFWIVMANWGCQHAWKPNYNCTFSSRYVWEWIPVLHKAIWKTIEDELFQYKECRQTLRKDSSSRRPVRRPYAYDLSQEDLLQPVKRMKTISKAVCKMFSSHSHLVYEGKHRLHFFFFLFLLFHRAFFYLFI
jgi:hypothetical protein